MPKLRAEDVLADFYEAKGDNHAARIIRHRIHLYDSELEKIAITRYALKRAKAKLKK